MPNTDKLSDMIDQMVREKTFGLDALDAIKALKDRAAAQELEIETLTKRVQEGGEAAASFHSKILDLSAKVTAAEERDAALKDREAKMAQVETAKAVAEARSGAFFEAFSMVFRNTIVR